jgi:hypothetical protein
MTNPFERGGNTPTQTPNTPPRQSAPSNGFSGGVGAMKSDDPYSAATPVGLSGVKMSDEGIIDQLLLVEPLEYVASINTRNGQTDAFRVNILPLTGPLAGELVQNVTVWQEALKRELATTQAGPNRWLLAYHHLGTAKSGQSAPYLFTPPDDEQMAIYNRFKAQQAAAQ